MSYKFGPDETLDRAFERISRQELDRAIEDLTSGVKRDPVVAVHTARKAIKKERSLLRLYRASLPAGQRRKANAELRAAARSLSGTRDADVMVATVEQLSDRFAGQLPGATFDAIRSQFAAQADRGATSHNQAVEKLQALRSHIDDLRPRGDGWKAIGRGLTRSYKEGRKAFARAEASRAQEDLHTWRKRVKDLWYHKRLLAPVAGLAVAGHAKEAHRLADLLGDDHDLGLLEERLAGAPPDAPVDVDGVRILIRHRRDELQTEAVYLGRRLYAESPKAFRRRMRRSFAAGQAGAAAPTEQRPAELAAAIRAPSH